MKKVNDLFEFNSNKKIKRIITNSKELRKGDLFVCIKGVNEDRHKYIDDAIEKKVSCIVGSKNLNLSVPYIKVVNPNKELPIICKKFYNDPLKNKIIIGITGTDGKTTTSTINSQLLKDCINIGTNGVLYKNKKIKENNTTPGIEKLYKYFSMFNSKYISMEVSSEALLHNRVDSIYFDRVIFTNITKDHLNVHKTKRNYINSKLKILNHLKDDSVLILNKDDKYYNLIKKKDYNKHKILTYGFNKKSDLYIFNTFILNNKTIFSIKYNNNIYSINSPLIGKYNIYNLCASILCLLSLNKSMEDIKLNIPNIKILGRSELFYFRNNTIILDYAHTINGINEILNYANSIEHNKIITITGCAGNRDKTKRKTIGKIVQNKSDFVIYTMDDPRSENVNSIIDNMIYNKKNNYIKEINRESAIKKAISMLTKNDILLILGKGRDDYMAIDDKYIKYSDYNILKNV